MSVLIVVFSVVALLFILVVLRGAPYVPTHPSSLNVLFDELLEVSDKDLVIDIGSGDGSVLRAAAKRGAHGLGYEINPVLVVISKILSVRYGARVRVKIADFWYVTFPPETTIVYTFGESRDIERMYKKVADEAARLRKPLRFVSYGFTVDGVEPVRQAHAMSIYQVDPLQQK